jgi:NADH-quinone oxidoreductase subunit N
MLIELQMILPEIVLMSMACALLVFDAFIPSERRHLTYLLAQLALLVTAVLVVASFPQITEYAFNRTFVDDPMSGAVKAFILVITLFIFFYSHDYLKEHGILKGEYFVLGLFAVLGMMIMASAGSLLTIYLGLELLSLCLYAMVAMHRDSPPASEAAMKYFVLGALASGLLLYGISIIYGISGTLDLQEINNYILYNSERLPMLVYGLVFIIVAIAFKLGAVPFHMWIPDVYQGAPTSVTLFISSAPKIAAFAMTIRFVNDAFMHLTPEWQGILIILSILSMAMGNIIAIAQSNIKRMLAYSTIAHIGFLLLGIISSQSVSATGVTGFADALFYVVTYALMSIGAFGFVILMGRKGHEADELDDYKGLADKNPWFALIMLIFMFSLAGVPPFVGFWAKWFVLKEIVATGLAPLAVIAVVFSIIGAYYYLRVVKLMYFDKPVSMTAIKATQTMRAVISLNGLAILLLGVSPGLLMTFCIEVMKL